MRSLLILTSTRLAMMIAVPVVATEIQWTRMTGQWPVEASPLVVKSSEGAGDDILVLNRGGQILLWNEKGEPVGPGQDGTVVQLPEGKWTTAPVVIEPADPCRFVVASVEGLVVGLDRQFKKIWEHQLAGPTVWGCASPAILQIKHRPVMVFSDSSGSATCLGADGKLLWKKSLGAGASKAAPQLLQTSDSHRILVPCGPSLFCLDEEGKVAWSHDLSQKQKNTTHELITRPEVLELPKQRLILCGNSAGTLFALNDQGKLLWACETGDTFSRSIAFVHRVRSTPLILATGLWGNLHAISINGRRVWTHLFRAKVRGAPLVIQPASHCSAKIFVPAFNAHVLQFNESGELDDDVRLSGVLPSALTPISNNASSTPDLLVASTTLLAYRLRPTPSKSPYGAAPEPENVTIRSISAERKNGAEGIILNNPKGGLLKITLSIEDETSFRRIAGLVTSRSAFEIAVPQVLMTNGCICKAVARNSSGTVLIEKKWRVSRKHDLQSGRTRKPKVFTGNPFSISPTLAYAPWDATNILENEHELPSGITNAIVLPNVYLDEVDQAAFVVCNGNDRACDARIALSSLSRGDGVAFRGTVVLRELVSTGSVNGEKVADALPALNKAAVITLLAHGSTKIWITIDTQGAEPGDYNGTVTFTPLSAPSKRIAVPLRVAILNLRLPHPFPLKLCTWDYVPNRWFPSRTPEVLDDMSRHGINIFPRSTIPAGEVNTNGALTIHWEVIDAELNRLKNRGKILFHLGHPPITYASEKSVQDKRSIEMQYIRELRDHLQTRGWQYGDYAFYLLDEPGLDYGGNIPALLDVGRLFREADPKLVTYTDPVPGLSREDLKRIQPLVDIWAPNMRLVSGLLSGDPRIQSIMESKTVWSYECVAQVKSLSPLRYNRANAWRAKFFGLSGIGFWTHSTTDADIWQAGKGINDEYALVYPGELPIPSVRWEAVRNGLEDVAAVTLLERQMKRHIQAGTQKDLVLQAEQEIKIALRDVMELSDAAFVETRDYLREGDRVLGHTWTDANLFQHHRAEIARLTLALSAK